MKKLLFLFSMAALMLASCGGPIKTGTLYSYDVVKSDAFVDTDTSKMPPLTSINVQGNYVTLKNGAQEYDYRIDKQESFEAVLDITSTYYTFILYVEKVTSSAPDLKYVRLNAFMDDFLVREESDFDYVAVITTNDDFWPYEVKGKVDIPRKTLSLYDETDLPKLVATNLEYLCNPEHTDKETVPDIIKNATGFTIEGTTFTLTDGTNTVSQSIYPCSDKEGLDGKYYSYSFYTKKTDKCPALCFMMADDGEGNIIAFVDDKDTKAEYGGFSVAHSDFKSWENLKRKICVCYPTDDAYNEWVQNNKE